MLLIAKRLLGALSLALGIFAAAFPQRFGRFLGLEADEAKISAFGAREIAAGSGLLSPVKPSPWLWMRVGGDLMDAFAMREALRPDNPRRKVAIAATAVLGLIVLADLALALHASLDKSEDRAAAT